MATLVLSTAGAAIGGMVGGPFGAIIGRAVGALAGGFIDSAIIGDGGQRGAAFSDRTVEGPRLSDLRVTGSAEGVPIPRVYGTARVGGQVIWATDLIEERIVTWVETGGGGGGGGKGGSRPRPRPQRQKRVDYKYYANFAVALCEGVITGIQRVWVDGKEMNLYDLPATIRIYYGDETQQPDALIAGHHGWSNTPAYRGIAYVVFERLALESFGNRIPQFSFEVVRPLDITLRTRLAAVNIIPGSGEFFCDTERVFRDAGFGRMTPENVHARSDAADWSVSLDQMQELLPAVSSAALIVSWFGNDLRCGHCTIRPGVDAPEKDTIPHTWKVAGIGRAQAHLVSETDGKRNYGGTPSDASVIRAIRDLRARGIAPVFYPFIMMDIPAGNTLPDPYTGNAGQPPHPWRGRITCDPAPDRPGTPDKTAALDAQLAAFIGTAKPGDFHLNGDEVVYTGPAEWSYRRFILHYAWLCKAAGGIDAFLVGSELRGLTTLRNGPASYPFVQALKALAADVKAILGSSVKVSYAADWSEYFGHHPQDGSGDVFFHLDPLWADANIDFIGIDNYMPLSDWRDGFEHLDAQAGVPSIYDLDYLKANIAGGEGFDWYYASRADRDAQIRTPITDGAYGKPWVFRYKDLKSWWENAHFDRPGGVESTTPTAWQPRSKPFWFTEMGCPAVDKGTNQPNVFYDPKSSESFLPYYSSGARDDTMQARYLRAMLEYWNAPGSHNPDGPYGGRMVDASRMFVWAWDARPWPQWPVRSDIWSDGGNWRLGHWLNGRLASGFLVDLVRSILADYDFDDYVIEPMAAQIDGYVLDRPMSARQALEPLSDVFGFDMRESGGVIDFHLRQRPRAAVMNVRDCIDAGDADAPLYTITREQKTEQPRSVRLEYFDTGRGHAAAAVEARTAEVALGTDTAVRTTISMAPSVAAQRARAMLAERLSGDERMELTLPPDLLGVEAGDIIEVRAAGQSRLWRVESLAGHLARKAVLRSHAPLGRLGADGDDGGSASLPAVYGPPVILPLDLPLLEPGDEPFDAHVAIAADPWPSVMSIERETAAGLQGLATATARSIVGRLLKPLSAGPLWVWDRANVIEVQVVGGTLSSVGDAALLAGANTCAIGSPEAGWEIVQFRDAELVDEETWRLSMLLRGQRGSEKEMPATHPVDSWFVLLNEAVAPLPLSPADRDLTLTITAGPQTLPPTDIAWERTSFTYQAKGARPFAPVHLRHRRLANGDFRFSWIRRTRIDGDPWTRTEPPIGEEQERYRLRILHADAPVRVIDTDRPEATWSAAEQAADFPAGLPASITVEVAQVSAAYGPGATLVEVMNV